MAETRRQYEFVDWEEFERQVLDHPNHKPYQLFRSIAESMAQDIDHRRPFALFRQDGYLEVVARTTWTDFHSLIFSSWERKSILEPQGILPTGRRFTTLTYRVSEFMHVLEDQTELARVQDEIDLAVQNRVTAIEDFAFVRSGDRGGLPYSKPPLPYGLMCVKKVGLAHILGNARIGELVPIGKESEWINTLDQRICDIQNGVQIPNDI